MSFEYPSEAVEAVTQDNFRYHFKGSEMVVAGKLQAQGPDVLTAKINGQTVSMIEHPRTKGQWGCLGSRLIHSQRHWAQVPVIPSSS